MAEVSIEQTDAREFEALIEKARWGDGNDGDVLLTEEDIKKQKIIRI